MGDIILPYATRSARGEKPRTLRYYFDTGSSVTFIKRSATRGMKNVSRLAVPEEFGGMGNGAFRSAHLVPLEVKLLGYWCRHVAYAVEDDVLEPHYDVLAGHDFMQRFNIVPLPRQKSVRLDPVAIQLSQKLKSRIRSRS